MIDLLNKLNPLAIVIIIAIITIFVSTVIAMILTRKKYNSIGQALDEIKKGNEDLHKYKVLEDIVTEFKESAKRNPDEVNTQAIIEKNFDLTHRNLYLAERFIKNSTSLMIILGLLGTFYGLTLSISQLVELLSNTASTEVLGSMDGIVGGLIESVKGMSVAFTTSLFGIASSVIITILNISFSVEDKRESLMIRIEEYLDNVVASDFKTRVDLEYENISNKLKNTFDTFGGKMENSINGLATSSSEAINSATKEMEKTTMSMLRTVQMFNESIDKFVENTRDFSEFNHHLRSNIERMSITFEDFTHDLKKNTRDIVNNQEVLKEAASTIEDNYNNTKG